MSSFPVGIRCTLPSKSFRELVHRVSSHGHRQWRFYSGQLPQFLGILPGEVCWIPDRVEVIMFRSWLCQYKARWCNKEISVYIYVVVSMTSVRGLRLPRRRGLGSSLTPSGRRNSDWWRSLKRPVPRGMGLPMIIHSDTPAIFSARARWPASKR